MNCYKLYQGDCLKVIKKLDDDSVDLILQDPPYNSTSCEWEWDILTKIDELWVEWFRVLKPDGNIVMTGSEPFSSRLRLSNIEKYKYDWVWNKKQTGNPFLVNKQPLKIHENIMVFGDGKYNPQMKRGKLRKKGGAKQKNVKVFGVTDIKINDEYYPVSIITESNLGNKGKLLHPTQKPVKLMEYLIKTYSDPDDVVLDGFIGSGTTMEASQNLRRSCIGIELLPEYCEITKQRCFTRTFLDREVKYEFMIVDGEQR